MSDLDQRKKQHERAQKAYYFCYDVMRYPTDRNISELWDLIDGVLTGADDLSDVSREVHNFANAAKACLSNARGFATEERRRKEIDLASSRLSRIALLYS